MKRASASRRRTSKVGPNRQRRPAASPKSRKRTEPEPSQSVTALRREAGSSWLHHRLYLAFESCFQEGIAPTDAVIAKKIGVRRESVCRFRARRPDVMEWIYEKVGNGALLLRPLVDRRVAQLAISGSVEHAKLFYEFVAKLGNPVDDERPAPPTSFTLNLLVPRPPGTVGVMQTAAPGATPLPAGAPLLADIPTVKVR